VKEGQKGHKGGGGEEKQRVQGFNGDY